MVICAVAAVLGWSPALTPVAAGRRAAAAVLGTAAFASLGLLVAGALRAEATLAAANLIYLLLMAGGAVVLPTDDVRRVRARAALPALRCAGRRACGSRCSASGFPGWHLSSWPGGPPSAPLLTARTFKWE